MVVRAGTVDLLPGAQRSPDVHTRGVFARVIAAGAVALLVAMFVLPAVWPDTPWPSTASAASCNGASHEIHLSAPDASPRSGTPTTSILFTVTYRDTAGCAPTRLVAVVPGAGQVALTSTSTAYASGVRFHGSMRLPIGTWAYRFDASSGSGGGTRTATIAGPGSIVITAPPKPTPTSTAKPTPQPTAVPPRATPRPGATAAPTKRPTAHPTATPTAHPTSGQGSGGDATSSPRPDGTGSPEPHSSQAGAGTIGGGADRGDDGTPAGAPADGPGLGLSGFALDGIAAPALMAWLGSTTLGVLLFALVFRGRGLAVEMPGELSVLVMRRGRRGRLIAQTPNGSSPDDGVLGPADGPSDAAPRGGVGPLEFEAARRRIGSTGREARRFAHKAAAGADRRLIAYKSVRVSAGADDLRTAELARLDRGDEVEVIGEDGGSLQIRTPDGVEGWVPRVVLVGPPTPDPVEVVDQPRARSAQRRWRLPMRRRGPGVADRAGEPSQP
jgi:hypothetical protein